jgi:hypothetical protein
MEVMEEATNGNTKPLIIFIGKRAQLAIKVSWKILSLIKEIF